MIALNSLERAALAGQDECGEEVKQFVVRNFYMDVRIQGVSTN